MLEKIDKLECDFCEMLNLIMALDNALGFAEDEVSSFGHLYTLSNLIVKKAEDNFELITNLSCQMTALHSEKNYRQ
ncbi:MAG: hypothetical protein ACLSWI_01315 [Candidatus Gastranaerophilaceae bacterium]